MAKWGKVDYRQFKKLQQNIEVLSNKLNMDTFCEDCCRELAARLLALVIPATPVGKYPKGSGKKGGTLRRGWGAKTAVEARAYAQSLHVRKNGVNYEIEIINPVEYASYVEYGHRTTSGGWVDGRYMLTVSEEKLKTIAPQLLERKLKNYLGEVFNVRN